MRAMRSLAVVAVLAAVTACGPAPTPPAVPVTPADDGDCPAGVTCHDTLPDVIDGDTAGGTTALAGYACAPGADDTGPERIHRVPVDAAGVLTVVLDDGAADVNVDVRILGSLDAAACVAAGTPDAAAPVEPGFAYVVFDTWADAAGDALAGPFSAHLTLAPPDDTPPDDTPPDDTPPDDQSDCPAGVTCIDTLPATVSGTTVDGAAGFDGYACAPSTDESGPELVYRVAVPAAGVLTVALDAGLEAGPTDVDVHILSADDPSACLARNDQRAAAHVDAGEAWVVLDSYVRADGTDGEGPFSATFSFLPDGDAGPDGFGPDALVAAGVPADVAALAVRAYNAAKAQDLTDSTVFSVIDFAMPSWEKRLWIVDLATGALLINDHVSHGSGSNTAGDPAMADAFSNTPGSNQTSLGLSRTAETYQGNHGYSLRLDGLEGSNDNMRSRAIVMHGATYAEDDFLAQNGYLGRSNGCFAVAQSRSAAVIDVVKEGTLIFAYYPQDAWLTSSPFLQ